MYITVLGRTDFEHPIFSIISSQSCFIEMDLLQKMFLLLGHVKNVIYSKLVNNPFKKKGNIFAKTLHRKLGSYCGFKCQLVSFELNILPYTRCFVLNISAFIINSEKFKELGPESLCI